MISKILAPGLFFLAAIRVEAIPEKELSLVCEREANPCFDDLTDQRFDIVSLMIEAALELKEYEIENGFSAASAGTADSKWSYTKQDGRWNRDSGTDSSHSEWTWGHHDKGVRRAQDSTLRSEQFYQALEDLDIPEEQVHRHLSSGLCNTICLDTPTLYICSFYCGLRRRRRLNTAVDPKVEVCTEEIHLHTVLADFPTESISECVNGVRCELTMPCTA